MKNLHKQFFFHLPLITLLLGTGTSCKEKQKPPDFKKDSSSTVLFKKEDSSHSISVEKIMRSSFQRFITSSGVVGTGPKFIIKTPATGKISYLPSEEGQSVKPEQIVCELDQTPVLLDLQYQTSLIEYLRERLGNFQDKGEGESAEVRELTRLLQVEEAQERVLENRRKNTRIKSPVEGRIQRIFVQPGEVVLKGAPIAEVIDISQVTVVSDIHQEDLPHLKKGMRVEIRLSQDTRQVFLGEVVRVGLEADPQTHRFPLEISLFNLQENFLPGMRVDIKARGPFMKNVLLVDKSSVREQDGEFHLFVLNGLRAELREVILGPGSEDKLIVRSGIKEGDQVILSPSSGLNDGDTVEISQ